MNIRGYKNNKHIVYSNKYHIVWCPKYRRPVLTGKVALRLKEIILNVANQTKSDVIELEIMPDHVHLRCEVDPQFGIHKLIKLIKGRSSRLLRSEFLGLKSRLPALWSNSYFLSTVGGAPLQVIKQYIENQSWQKKPNHS